MASRGFVESVLSKNVSEVSFMRRHAKAGATPIRRMLCTRDWQMLSTPEAKLALNFRAPTQNTSANIARKNLIVVWDIFVQDWRNIPLETLSIHTSIPTEPAVSWWEVFNNSIFPMTQQAKVDFMQNRNTLKL